MGESKPIVLRSFANPTVRHLVRMRDNRHRRRAERVIVDGWRETAAALQAGLPLRAVYLPLQDNQHAQWPAGPRDSVPHDAVNQVRKHTDRPGAVHWVTQPVMDKISYGQSSRGIVAEFCRPERSLNQIQLPDCPLLLILDRIEKPGNLGAVFRTADAAGVHAVLLCESADPFSPNAIRASLGAVFHVPLAEASLATLADFLPRNQIHTWAARVESSTPLWQCDLTRPTAIVLGSEAEGIGPRWTNLGQQPIAGLQIPMRGHVDSLNVSITAAIIAFEAARQRGRR